MSATITTSAPFIYITSSMMTALQAQFKDGVFNCDDNGCWSWDTCENLAPNMPTLEFQMTSADGNDNFNMKLSPLAYTWYAPSGNIKCNLMVKQWDQVVLGTIFLTNFVTTFDMDNNQILLQANPNAPEGVAITQTAIIQPSDDGGDGLSSGAIAGIVVGSIVGLILIFVGIYCFMCKGKKGQERNFSQYSDVGGHNSNDIDEEQDFD